MQMLLICLTTRGRGRKRTSHISALMVRTLPLACLSARCYDLKAPASSRAGHFSVCHPWFCLIRSPSGNKARLRVILSRLQAIMLLSSFLLAGCFLLWPQGVCIVWDYSVCWRWFCLIRSLSGNNAWIHKILLGLYKEITLFSRPFQWVWLKGNVHHLPYWLITYSF